MDNDILDISLYNGLNVNYSEGLASNIISSSGLNIIYINGRSIRNKLTEIELLLNNFNGVVHILVVTETWLKINDVDFFNLANYKAYHNTREKHGGGVAIYCHENIESNLTFSEHFMINSHCLITKITVNNLNFHVGVIYRPPDHRLKEFIDQFSVYLNTF